MAERGLFIDIEGAVSQKLLMSMERLKQKLDRLSRAAMKYSTVAKTAGQVELGRGLDRIAREAKESSTEISRSYDEIGDAIERNWKRSSASIQQFTNDVSNARAQLQQQSAFGDRDLPNLRLRNDLYQEYNAEIGNTIQGQKQAKRRSDELADAITKQYRSLYEVGRAGGEGRQTLQEYAESVDVAKLRHLDLNNQLKITKNGFANLSDEARDALKLNIEDVDALTGRYSKLEENVGNLDHRVESLGRRFKEIDIRSDTDIKGFRTDISNVRRDLNKLAPQMDEVFGPEYVADMRRQLDEYDANLKNAIDSHKRLSRQKTKDIDLQKKHAFEIQSADAATREYHANRQKQISDTIKRTEELRERMDRFDEIKYDPKQLRMLKKDVDSLVRNVDKLEEPMRLEWGDQGVESFRELRNEAYGLQQEYTELEKSKTENVKQTQKEMDLERKHTTQLENLKTQIREIRDTDFEAIPEGQLPERLKEVRSINRQLSQMRKHMSADEYNEFADVLNNADKRASKLVATQRHYNETGRRTTGVIGRLWRKFQRISHAIIQQVHLWGILGVVIVGAQAAYAGLATWATKAAASLSDNAEKLNMSVQSMQEFQAAATATGTSTRDLNEALESLNDTVIDALKGKSKAVDAFDALGIQFDTLVNKGNNTEEMFELVMERLDEVNSSAKRLALAKDIFGEGPASTLMNLVGSLEEARDAMKQFDITMSEEATNSAEILWNKFRGLWLVIKRQFISAAVEASHVMNNFADQILEAAAKGNLFEGTIVPAVKSTIGILKALYDAGKVVYWILHRLYEAWDVLIVPIKALMGLGVVYFFRRITVGIQTYITSMKGATAWTTRFGIALKGVLRATGYYLLIEGIMWITSALQEASEVANKTKLTFTEAFKAITEEAAQSLVQTLGKIIANLPSILGQAAWIAGKTIGKQIWAGIKSGATTHGLPSIYNMPTLVSSLFGGGEGGAIDSIASKESKKILERIRKQAEKTFKDIDIFENVTQGADKSRAEMLKTAEVAEGAGKDIIGTVEDMADAGRVEDVEQLIPFARTEVQDKIDETRRKLEEYRDYIEYVQELPPNVGMDVDPEILQKYEQLKVRMKELREQKQKLQADIPVKAQMNKFEENLSNSMERAKLKFKEGSMDLLQYQEQILSARVKKYQELLKNTGITDQLRRNIKNKLLETQNELAEVESEQLEHRYNVIQKGAERNIQTIENEMEQRNLALEEQVAKGKKYEEDAALERARAQEQASKEILEIRKNEVERTKDLLGESLAEVREQYGANSEEVEWFKETIQAKEEADQQYTEDRIARIKQIQQTAEQAFQREQKLAQLRRDIATADQLETGVQYEENAQGAIQAINRTEEVELESLRTRRNALQQYRQEVLAAYDERIAAAREGSAEQERLMMERRKFAKNTYNELIQLENEYARERVRQEGSVWQKIQLGMANYYDEARKNLTNLTSMTKSTADIISGAFSNAFSDFILGTKNASEAWQSFTDMMLKQITKMMTQYLVQRFFMMAMSFGAGMMSPAAGASGASTASHANAGMAHTGGVVGRDVGFKLDSVNSAIASAMLPRKHNGGGMRSDEYAVVAQRGEEIRSREQTSRDKNKGGDSKERPVINNNITVQAPEGKVAEESLYQIKKKAARGLQQTMMRD